MVVVVVVCSGRVWVFVKRKKKKREPCQEGEGCGIACMWRLEEGAGVAALGLISWVTLLEIATLGTDWWDSWVGGY